MKSISLCLIVLIVSILETLKYVYPTEETIKDHSFSSQSNEY